MRQTWDVFVQMVEGAISNQYIAARSGRSTIKLTCRTKTGVYLPTEMTFHAFESSGHLYVLGLVQDRSEHRVRPREG